MKTIKLTKGNKVDLTTEQFKTLVNSIEPNKEYIQLEKRELKNTNEQFDSLNVISNDGENLMIPYSEYIYFHHESKEAMIFKNEQAELSIFYSANSDEVFCTMNLLESVN